MKPLIIYHNNCADGFGAAFAAWLKFGDEAEYLPMQYGKDYSKSENVFEFKAREIYILDFSFPRDIMDMLFTGAKRTVWLDHHKTAFEMSGCAELYQVTGTGWPLGEAGDHYTLLDNSKSGAMLAWEYFHPGTEVPMLIRHIDDYDRWQFKLEGTKALNKAIWSLVPWTFDLWSLRFLHEVDLLIAEGEAVLRAHDQNVQSVVKGAARKCHLGLPHPREDGAEVLEGLAANCPPHLTSDVGHTLATQSGTFGLCWHISKDGKCLCSLRSNGDYDVSAIAKAFGGGGHRNAAGFEVSVETLLGWLK